MKKVITILIIIILIILISISILFMVKHLNNKSQIHAVKGVYSEDKVQERLDTDNNVIEDNLLLQIDGETVIGIIKIDKINFEGLVYEGTSQETLKKGVGHFENSSYIDGNVCLAAHNTNKFWAKLHTLEKGDKITYSSFLGTREYEVTNITKISETDWSLLKNTSDNFLTLITCVKGSPSERLCVQALAID